MIVEVVLRHYKTYYATNRIPISRDSNFITFIGDNGIGKSSIFEALDTLFNKREWNINLKALSGGGLTNRNEPYISCLFAIEKDKIKNEYINIFEQLDSIFRKEYKDYKDEFENRYLVQLGKMYFSNKQPEIYFGTKDADVKDIIKKVSIDIDEEKASKDGRTEAKLNRRINDIGEYILNFYSYIYIPVEMDINEFSFLVNSEMQKLTGKNIRDEIKKIVTNNKLKEINTKLAALVKDISSKLTNYSYDFKSKGKHTISMDALVSKIIEEYFYLRVLKHEQTEVSKLSSGEKRKALVELSKSLLETQESFDSYMVFVVDEPEASLNLTKCYFQFEDLYKLSEFNHNLQVMIATHWYGHLPIITNGDIHFLSNDDDKIKFDSFKYGNYLEVTKKHPLPEHISLKSTNDLVQSIIASLRYEKEPYNWLLCEGTSDKKYLEYFLGEEIRNKNLRILPVGGIGDVIKIYKYLMLPLEEKNSIHGKVFCLVDTDTKIYRYQNIPKTDLKKLKIKRLANSNTSKTTKLIEANDISDILTPTVIEDSLDKQIFINTIQELASQEGEILEILNDEKNINNIDNSFFCFSNMRPDDKEKIMNFVSSQKVNFSEKYIEIAKNNSKNINLEWINEIKNFFDNQ